MPEKKKTEAEIAKELLKDDYVKFFEDCPKQNIAAQFIGKTEATIINWKKEDEDFLNRVNKAEAKFIKNRLLKTQAEFQLTRLFNSHFPEPPKGPQDINLNVQPLTIVKDGK